MIVWGGPPICAACHTLMHDPTEACPTPLDASQLESHE